MKKSNSKTNNQTSFIIWLKSTSSRIWELFTKQGVFLQGGKDLGNSPIIERLFNSRTRAKKFYLTRDAVYAGWDVTRWLVAGASKKPGWLRYFFREPAYALYLMSGKSVYRNASSSLAMLKFYNLLSCDHRTLGVIFNKTLEGLYVAEDLATLHRYVDCLCAIPDWLFYGLSAMPDSLQVVFIWLFGSAYSTNAVFGAFVTMGLTSFFFVCSIFISFFVLRRVRAFLDSCENTIPGTRTHGGLAIQLGSYGSFSLSQGSFFFPVTKPVRSWPLTTILNKHLGDYPTPANLSYFWSFGSLAGICLGVQLVTGIILAMHYVANADLAFASVEHIMRDVNGGWLIRYLHANGASFFFIAVYTHIARAIFYRSYVSNSLAWSSGVLIFFLLMATAFIGYVLPWGQMSYWGATVITNLFSAIPGFGIQLVWWLWGGFSVSNATLNRFFSLHYLLPIIIAVVALLHLFFLHGAGSSNPLGVNHSDKLPFFPYFVLKDVIGLFVFAFVFLFFVFYFPNVLGHFDNYIEANPFITPMHIVPEWYFLPFYAILRSIPNKLGGVLCMGVAIVILAILPFIDATRLLISPRFSYFSNNSFWLFALATLLLGWLGGVPVEFPFVIAGQISTLVYFSFFGMLLPGIVILEFYVLSAKSKFFS